MARFNRVDITLAVDGGDVLNELDLARLAEIHSHYNKLTRRPRGEGVEFGHSFERLQQEVQKELDAHIRRHKTFLSVRSIHIRGALLHNIDDHDHHIVILPKRATWDAVNHAYDYLNNDRPEVADPDYDSTIRHWAANNLSKYLDVNNGFSRLPSDRRDCFDLILTLQKAMRHTNAKIELSEGVAFNIAVKNTHPLREERLLYIHHCLRLQPF
ncbi:hypothetical protein [Streptomyces sp. CHB9.2]|uniref:hypothetical protein n=1 Tax=Streptomyces sp. CHB9.2 TaxID=2841670 RepID=UPI002094CC65|nr:hypothetical protein [Streptomyces sp. CHB9.2]MCO6704777.1 hypothetical protein [Streptomyces sp. CHB9.2]